MKKPIGLFLLLWALWMNAAQGQRGLEIGIVAIPQVSAMYDSAWWKAGDELNYAFTMKGAGGIQAAINLTSGFGIGGGLLYSMQGQHFTTGQDYKLVDSMGNQWAVPQRKFGFDMLYYKVPVFLKLNTSVQAPVSFMFMAGLQFGFLQEATFFDKGAEEAGVVYFPVQEVDYKSRFEEVDMSAMVALDGRYNIAKRMYISLLLRGDYSLRSVVKADPATGVQKDVRNINLGVQLGIHYIIGR